MSKSRDDMGTKIDERKGKQRGGRPPRKKTEVFSFEALKWSTIKNSRESMSAILTAFGKGELTESKLRPAIYAARALLAFLEAERGLELDVRLERLERLVEEIIAKGGIRVA